MDIVKTKTAGEIKGVIVEQSYESQKDEENYFLIKTESQTEQKVKVADIVELRKVENPKYDPKFDVLLKEGEILVNRQKASFVNVLEKGDFLQLDSIGSLKVNLGKDGKAMMTVEYRVADGTKAEAFQLVKVTKQTIKKNDIYGFTYKDLVNAVYHPSGIETSVNHTTKAEYSVNNAGIYAFYDAKGKKAIPIIIIGQKEGKE